MMALDADQAGESDTASDHKVVASLRRALDFFDAHSKDFDNGQRRVVVYPGLEEKHGDTGVLALLALAHIDYLRTAAPEEAERGQRREHLVGLLESLRRSVREDDGLV